ncbi:MAG: hypothetical protein M1383_05410 [Patescibacteria group bacterium]|nr:hypothetical protein [Patescibacteria group bacterium]
MGIKDVKKVAYASIFEKNDESPLNIWIQMEQDADWNYPHMDTEDKLDDLIKEHKQEFPEGIYKRMRAMVLQDAQGSNYLLVSEGTGELINLQKTYSATDDFNKKRFQRFLKLLEEYKIDKVIAKGAANEEEKQMVYGK